MHFKSLYDTHVRLKALYLKSETLQQYTAWSNNAWHGSLYPTHFPASTQTQMHTRIWKTKAYFSEIF